MKKLLSILLCIAVLFLCGCAPSQPNEALGNSGPSEKESAPSEDVLLTPFTDEFFADVVRIGDTSNGWVSGDQMAPVIDYLKSLKLEQTDVYLSSYDENGNMLVGLSGIDFELSDGTTISFLHNHMTLTNTDGSGSFVLSEGNLNLGLQEAFNEAYSAEE